VQSTQIENLSRGFPPRTIALYFVFRVPQLILLAFQIDSLLVAGGTVLAFSHVSKIQPIAYFRDYFSGSVDERWGMAFSQTSGGNKKNNPPRRK
jgi:hypothetical protein